MSAVCFENVCAGYVKRNVLSGVSLRFEAGAVTGLAGPNGAGKTTLLRAAIGLLPVTRGRVVVLDRALEDWGRPALARAIAYLPQNADPHWPIEVRRLVALGRMPHRMPFAPVSASDERAIGDVLARCDATQFATRSVGQLSAGERARVLLARALAVSAPVLLVDEPAAHLDPAHQLQTMELLRAEAQRGTAVVVTLHDLSLASRFCDEIIVLASGRVAGSGPPNEALDDRTLEQVFGVSALRADLGVIVPWQRV